MVDPITVAVNRDTLVQALTSLRALRDGYVAYLDIAIEECGVDEVHECDGDEHTIEAAESVISDLEEVLGEKEIGK